MQTKLISWADLDILHLCGEDDKGSLAELVRRFETVLGEYGLSLDDAVFHRFWTRDRATRVSLGESREQLLGGRRKTATSSFISASHILSGGSVALEMVAFKPKDPGTRRLVDFTPPRAYAHYMVQDGWLFLSGMAEDAPTMDGQFDKAFTQVELALENEKLDWGHVRKVNLFLERGAADIAWLKDRFQRAVRVLPRHISIELVDGLASPEKKLEIEVVATSRD